MTISNKKIAVIGASGGVGSAFVDILSNDTSNTLYAFSRSGTAPENIDADNLYRSTIDFADESSIQQAAEFSANDGPLDIVIVATGILHDTDMMPEKSLRDVSVANLEKNFFINTVGPALALKYFADKLNPSAKSLFAILSARVGSISDNGLGGWYSYRTSKAALNMFIKTASIEIVRRRKQAVIVGLHPGTVNTQLSKPFQQRVPEHKLFSCHDSAQKLTHVIAGLSAVDNGKIFAWDGSEVPY